MNIEREEVSVYDLTPHPDFTFNVGDVVVRIATSQTDTLLQPAREAEEPACAGQVRRIPVIWKTNISKYSISSKEDF